MFQQKPVFVLLHGAWHTPKCWDLLVSELDKAGYKSVAPALPSSNASPLPSDWSADLDTIRTTVRELIEAGRDVIVVMHSFSGMTGGTALNGLDKESCAAEGPRGGVVRLIYVNAFLVPENTQHSPPGTSDNMIPEMKADPKAGTVIVLPEDVKEMFHQDLDEETSRQYGRDLRPHSLGSYWGKTKYAAWRHIPTSYIICTEDRPLTVQIIHGLIARATEGEHKIDNVIELKAGHSPFLSQPQWTVGILIAEAGRARLSNGTDLVAGPCKS